MSRLRPLVLLVASVLLFGCGANPTLPASTPPSPSASAAAAPSSGAMTPTATDPASVARTYIGALSSGDVATAEAMQDDTMRGAAPASSLDQLWQQVVTTFGAFQRIGDVTTESQPPYTVVTVPVVFADATVPLIVAVIEPGQVAGLHLGEPTTSASPTASASPAAYVDRAAFTERDVTVGVAPWAVPGTLSMPNGDGPFPAVVLIAGSGPEDRDETIGPNKPLRDLAWGLASAGIAVLRYDKRTLTYGAKMAADPASITVKEETTDDAVSAIELLRSTPGVDPSRVFLLGHSLGGFLAPRITAQVPDELRGIILVEASSTPLAKLILEQTEYLVSLQGSPGPSASDALAALRAQVARAESPDLSPSTPASELPLGVPANYWLDLRTYDPLKTASGLRVPMLFVQGGRDYQTPPSELVPWQNALAGRSDVTFQTYPALNHLLVAGSGPSTPDEYAVPGHVDAGLVSDLVAWIKGR